MRAQTPQAYSTHRPLRLRQAEVWLIAFKYKASGCLTYRVLSSVVALCTLSYLIIINIIIIIIIITITIAWQCKDHGQAN